MLALYFALTIIGSISFNWGFETSQSYIFSIVPGNDGTMWCATAGGIIHYDPAGGWLDSLAYPDQMPWISAIDLHFDNSLMWVATGGGGLALLQEDSTWKIFTSYEGIPGSGYVYSVYDAGGYIWVGSDGGLSRGNTDSFLPIDSDLTGGAFTATKVMDIAGIDNTMYLATDRGVYALDLTGSIYNPGSWTSHEDSTLTLGIDDIYIVSADSVFGYGSGGVSQMIGDSWIRLLDYSTSTDSVVTGLLLTEDGLIAACRKVLLYNGGVWEHYGSGYPDGRYASCLSEVFGKIWCGYGLLAANCCDTGNGLGYLDNGTWENLPVPGMGAPSCYQMAWDENRVYLGSHRVGLMANYPDSGWTAFNNLTADMPHSLRTYSAAKSSSSGIWTGSYHWGLTWIEDRGTYSMDDDTVITYVSDSLPDLPSEVVQIVSPLLNNQVIMLTSQGGALLVAQEAFWQTPDEPSGIVAVSGEPEGGILQWTSRTESDGLANKNIQMMFPCGGDSLWIAFASENGCQLLVHGGDPTDKSSDTWYPGYGQAYSTSWGLSSNKVFCFARNAGGDILAGTGNGISRWNGDLFVDVAGVSGSVKAMQVDNNGVIWCMTEAAIYSIDEGNVTEFTRSNSIYISTNRMENEFSSINPEDGTVYFSSIAGLWSILSQQSQEDSPDLLFYPQPFLPVEGELHMAWSGSEDQIEVRFFSLTGEYLGCVPADSWEEWIFDGTLDGAALASGVYVVLVDRDGDVFRCKIAVVR